MIYLNALLPSFSLIALGYNLKHPGFLGPEFWARAEKFAFYVLLPALLFKSLASAQFGHLDLGPTL